MNKLRLSAIFVFTIFALGSTAAIGAAAQGLGRPSPDYNLKDLEGNAVSSSALKGKIVIVNFWATWCPPCREEIPDFIAFYNEHKTKGLEMIGLSVDQISAAQLKMFVQKNKMTYPVVLAEAKLIRAFDPGSYIPTTFIIDKKGIIRHIQVGRLDKATLISWFDRLSKE
jgi:peroxiredoxin